MTSGVLVELKLGTLVLNVLATIAKILQIEQLINDDAFGSIARANTILELRSLISNNSMGWNMDSWQSSSDIR